MSIKTLLQGQVRVAKAEMIGIILTITGIVILIRRKASLTRNKVVVGWPALAVGLLFVMLFPIGFILGIALAMYVVATGGSEADVMKYALPLDFGLLFLVLLTAVMIFFMYGKPEHELNVDRGSRDKRRAAPPVLDESNPYKPG